MHIRSTALAIRPIRALIDVDYFVGSVPIRRNADPNPNPKP